MPGHYSNDFHDQGVVGGKPVFHPQVDHYNPGSLTFGDMIAGVSLPVFSGPPVSFSSADGGGLTVGVTQDPGGGSIAVSRPVSVLEAKDGSNAELFNLSNAQALTAEIEFDHPAVDLTGLTMGPNPLNYVWALGLVLRDGDGTANETGLETRIQTTCQFFNGGYIHFHGTDYVNPAQPADPTLVKTGTYAGYQHTNFRLSMTISRKIVGGAVKLSGTAEFWAGPDRFSGNLKNLPTDIGWAKAVGFSLVSARNLLPGIGIRVKRFTLTVDA